MPIPRPEPVTKAGAIAGAVAAVILAVGLLARALGWLADDVDVEALALRASDVVLAAGAVWATLAPLALAYRARAKVTPVADPRDATGAPLVPEPAGPTLLDVLDALEELLELVELASIRAPASSSRVADVVVDEDQADELVRPSLYDELVAERAGPPTVEFPAVRVIDTAGRPPVPPAAGA